MDLVAYPQRGEVWLVSLEPTIGSEIRKTRPCVVVSPNETNRLLRTVIDVFCLKRSPDAQ